MSFASPDLLAFLAVVPLALLAVIVIERRRSRLVAAWTRPALLPNMARDPALRRAVPPAFFLAAASVLLVGFARPETHRSEVKPGATIVLAVDQSGSMAASDVPPTRLAASDALLTRFVDGLPAKYRVALVTFSADEEVAVAPTYDHKALVAALPRTTQLQGTAIGDAITLAVHVAESAVGPPGLKGGRPPATVLLVSDGGQNAGRLTPAQGEAAAKKAGVPVSTIVVGTPEGTVTQHLRVAGSGSRTVTLTTEVPDDPAALKQIASATGGSFFQAPSQAALASVYKGLGQRLVHSRVLREFTVVLIVEAIVLVGIGALLSAYWFRRLA